MFQEGFSGVRAYKNTIHAVILKFYLRSASISIPVCQQKISVPMHTCISARIAIFSIYNSVMIAYLVLITLFLRTVVNKLFPLISARNYMLFCSIGRIPERNCLCLFACTLLNLPHMIQKILMRCDAIPWHMSSTKNSFFEFERMRLTWHFSAASWHGNPIKITFSFCFKYFSTA